MKEVQDKGLETDEQRRWFFANLPEVAARGLPTPPEGMQYGRAIQPHEMRKGDRYIGPKNKAGRSYNGPITKVSQRTFKYQTQVSDYQQNSQTGRYEPHGERAAEFTENHASAHGGYVVRGSTVHPVRYDYNMKANGGGMTEETKAATPATGCVGDRAVRYESAGMTPVLALMRAEQDCVDAATTNGNDAPDNSKSLDDACYKKAIIRHMAAGMINAEAQAKARTECADATPGLGEPGAGKPKKSLAERIDARLKQLGLLGSKDAGELTSFKVAGNHWLATWSNDFKDRDGEIFTRKAIDDYVARVDMGVVKPPELWVWHIGKAVSIGAADWVAREGHFLVAGGQFYGGDQAVAAKAYYVRHASDTGISHGFSFPADKFDGKHYHQFNTFEISLLPRGSEANLYTSLEGVKAMALDEKKRKYLETVFGKDHAEQIVKTWDERGKALEALDVEYKDFVGDGAPAGDANKEAVTNVETALKDLIPDLLEGSGDAIKAATEAIREVKAQRAEVAVMRSEMDKLRSQVNLAPRSVQQRAGVPELEISKEQAKREFGADGAEIVVDKFWGVKVKRDAFAELGEEGK